MGFGYQKVKPVSVWMSDHLCQLLHITQVRWKQKNNISSRFNKQISLEALTVIVVLPDTMEFKGEWKKKNWIQQYRQLRRVLLQSKVCRAVLLVIAERLCSQKYFKIHSALSYFIIETVKVYTKKSFERG